MKKGEWFAGIGVAGACALCCLLPLIGGIGVVGVSSIFLNPIIVGTMSFIFVIAVVVVYHKRKASGSSCMKTGCNCNSCSKD